MVLVVLVVLVGPAGRLDLPMRGFRCRAGLTRYRILLHRNKP